MMMFKKILLIGLLSMGLCACERSNSSVNVVMASEASAPVEVQPETNLLEDRERLSKAQQSLQNLPAFQGKIIQVFGNIDFFDGVRPRIELSVQSPEQPDDVWILRYEHGKWSDPILDEEEQFNAKQMARFLTPLNEIHFEDVVSVAQHWRKKANEVNAVWTEPYHVAFIWLPKLKKRFWHTAEIDAVGAQYYLSLNIDGSIFEWKKIRE